MLKDIQKANPLLSSFVSNCNVSMFMFTYILINALHLLGCSRRLSRVFFTCLFLTSLTISGITLPFSIVQRYRKNINLLDGVHVQIIYIFFYLINLIVCDNNVWLDFTKKAPHLETIIHPTYNRNGAGFCVN